MQARRITLWILTFGLATVIGLAGMSDASARHRKRPVRTVSPESVFWGNMVPTDKDGTPIIMRGYRAPGVSREAGPPSHANSHVRIPRGSSSTIDIPPVNPSPYSSNSPPARALTQPPPQPYKPPPINSYSDRVTNCIHSFPLNGGIGNNPSDQQSYVRQCAN